jgi:uncharacterized protein YqfB (UPF0267 family)
MGLYNFQERFVPNILTGQKTHTIRAKRKNPDKAGNTLHLYVGLRRRGAALIMRARCIKVEDIVLRVDNQDHLQVIIDGVALDQSEKELFAQRDGFSSFWEMCEFWNGLYPFNGDLIHWKFPGEN